MPLVTEMLDEQRSKPFLSPTITSTDPQTHAIILQTTYDYIAYVGTGGRSAQGDETVFEHNEAVLDAKEDDGKLCRVLDVR